MGKACTLSHRAATLHRFNAKKGKNGAKSVKTLIITRL
jgi:hypothetical protein